MLTSKTCLHCSDSRSAMAGTSFWVAWLFTLDSQRKATSWIEPASQHSRIALPRSVPPIVYTGQSQDLRPISTVPPRLLPHSSCL